MGGGGRQGAPSPAPRAGRRTDTPPPPPPEPVPPFPVPCSGHFCDQFSQACNWFGAQEAVGNTLA